VSISSFFVLEEKPNMILLRLQSADQTNRLTNDCMSDLQTTLAEISTRNVPLVITGNQTFFSAGADLKEISDLTGPAAYEFSKKGQTLMNLIADFPSPVYAAISGYCMGGGLDLALACHHRITSPQALFGHRGAALGLITGWGGTQRLPRLVGKGMALQMFVAAERIGAQQALAIGLVDALVDDPVSECKRRVERGRLLPEQRG
jgi:enoyl-CoA hydratase